MYDFESHSRLTADILQAMYHFLLVVCNDNVSILHRFKDTTAFVMFVTACDFEKIFTFDEQ